jgi:hypothetical protein
VIRSTSSAAVAAVAAAAAADVSIRSEDQEIDKRPVPAGGLSADLVEI